MKKLISLGIIFFMMNCSLVSFIGCGKKTNQLEKTVSAVEEGKKNINMEIYIKEEVKLGKNEPISGAYLGAYIGDHKDAPMDIAGFDKLLRFNQTFNVMQYTAEEGLSSQDILKCMAQRKVPYIKILLSKDLDLTTLYRMISDLKTAYHVPVFIELFPITGHITDPIAYKTVYQRAYELLQKYLEDVVVVWSVEDSRIYDMPLYYPGDDYIDWVGLNISIPKYRKGVSYTFEGLSDIDFWYKSFQKTKPMIISALAISQFSRVDHTYDLRNVKNYLDVFYQELPGVYPRLKGILYIDVDMGQISSKGMDDYRISNQKQLSDHLKNVLKNADFLQEIEENTSERLSGQYMKYSIVATEIDKVLYLPQDTMKIFFKQVPLSKIDMKEDLEGTKFYKLEDIKRYADLYYKKIIIY